MDTRLMQLGKLLTKLKRTAQKCIIIGDFNVPNDRAVALVQTGRLKDTFTVRVVPDGITKNGLRHSYEYYLDRKSHSHFL